MPQAKKKKGKGKKILKPDHSTDIKQKEQEAEQERLRNWEDSWKKKLREQEERDNAECCAAKGLCLKPRTQSNVWVNVTRDRSIQEIHMSFNRTKKIASIVDQSHFY
ncbi:uncharacterized protein LOC143148194 isoform X2 [Ptiloglossa arizonensis]|uniref:uncharacterized protein LOC143148194 isoform X2 n=1 Tax=Ptiloglossa arizonensis TaxID=3350558 RepID=UPI003FA121D2